jgi:hypothetical protein
MLVLALGLIGFIAIGVFPPRQYGYTAGNSELTGLVPERKLLFADDFYTGWHKDSGYPAEIDTGRLFAEALMVLGASGLLLVLVAMVKR